MALNHVKHKNIILKILKDIYTNTNISNILGFKGGTAAYLFYDLPRFSVDLDFDLLDSSKEDQVMDEIEKIISKYGQVKEKEKKRFNLFLLLSYEKDAHNIKIEINRRNFNSSYEVKSYLGISIKTMIQPDMTAHKFVAMYERIDKKAHRDIFDIWFFLQNNWPINKEIITNRTGLSFKQFLEKNINLLEQKSNHDILAGMGELLDEKQKNWVKNNLIKDIIFLLKLNLEQEINIDYSSFFCYT